MSVLLRSLLLLSYTLIGVLAYLLCIHFIGVESMRYSDEVTHARVIQEGIDSGSWFQLTLDGEPYYRKPPFKMWLTRLVVALFGEGNLQYRILDGLATATTVLATMLLALRLFGSHLCAALSGLLLLGSWDFLVESRNNQGTQDALLLLLITASMCVGWRLLQQACTEPLRSIHWLVVQLSLLLGLAISTKSLAGALPEALLFLSLLFTLRSSLWGFVLRHCRALLIGLVITIAIPGIYYVPLFLRAPGAWDAVFRGEIYDRLLGDGYNNQQRWYLYLEGIMANRPSFPLPLMLLGTLVALGQLKAGRDRRAWGFLLLWIALPLGLYSSFSSRVFHYIAPIFPPLAILSGRGLDWLSTAAFRWVRACSSRLLMSARLGCIILVLLPAYYLVSDKLYKSFRSISESGRKLDIEQIATEIRSSSAREPTRVILYKMERPLAETGNQAWRFKFYLHLIRALSLHTSDSAQVRFNATDPRGLWVLTPLEYSAELNNLGARCEHQPFVHPHGKRNHYRQTNSRSARGGAEPQFLLIRCK